PPAPTPKWPRPLVFPRRPGSCCCWATRPRPPASSRPRRSHPRTSSPNCARSAEAAVGWPCTPSPTANPGSAPPSPTCSLPPPHRLKEAPMAQPLAIVSGAAGDIGRAMARRFLDDGYAVAALERSEELAESAAAAIQSSGTARGFAADQTDRAQLEAAL